MASRPEEPPESIILQSFAGVRNLVAPERLGVGDLEAAVNIDLDDAGQPRRRRGIALGSAGDFHSVRTLARGTLGVKDGALGWIDPDLTFRQVQADVGSSRVAYVQVGENVHFSSTNVSGIIAPNNEVLPWGLTDDAGFWLSPVVNPTETLGAVSGKLLAAPPMATELELYKGRIYLAQRKTLWATELFLYNYIDKTRTFTQFEHDITLVMAVDDGLYVGTGKGLFFLQGTLSDGLKRSQISDAAVLQGSGVVVPTERVHPQARQGPVPEGTCAVFMTSEGMCVGLDGGQVFNLTRDRMVFPAAQSAAALYREQDGVTQVVAVTNNGGAPTSTARIGDYCDAEIVRAADRGV